MQQRPNKVVSLFLIKSYYTVTSLTTLFNTYLDTRFTTWTASSYADQYWFLYSNKVLLLMRRSENLLN